MKQTILGLRAETSIHAGTGQNNGVIDRPVQREEKPAYPCVFGSSVKGAFKAHAETRFGWGTKVQEVFGRENAESPSNVSMTDAQLLLLPVRSLTSHFKLVTCPCILDRLNRNMQMMGIDANFGISNPAKGTVIGHKNKGTLFLEEFQFEQKEDNLSVLLTLLERFGVKGISEQLLVMHNDDFAWFAKNATVVTPHIAIDNESKTVIGGALWYEEALPSDTLLYTMLMGKGEHVDAVLGMFEEGKEYIQIGGNETVGMGWFHVQEVTQ